MEKLIFWGEIYQKSRYGCVKSEHVLWDNVQKWGGVTNNQHGCQTSRKGAYCTTRLLIQILAWGGDKGLIGR